MAKVKDIQVWVGPNQRAAATAFFVKIEFADDVTAAHPYVHAHTVACRYRSQPPHARFYWKGKECVLYEKSCLAGVFEDREQAEAFAPKLIALVNETLENRSNILPAEPNRRPLKVLDILRLLPRTNCGECGFETCLAFAVALGQEELDPWSCPHFPKPRESRATYLVDGVDQPLVFNLDEHRRQRDGNDAERCDLSALSPREVQVLELMALGFSNKEIAANLEISPHTVKAHTVKIFEKLDCTDRTQASVLASRAGLV